MRDRGTFNFSGNLEVKKDAPLEARSLVNSYADLVKPETWTDEQGGIWKYDCMLVSCKDRPGKVYQLSPGADYTKESSWILIGDTSELNNKVQEFIDSKGAPNGLASLNESGIIPSAQLPSYVDDVIEVDTFSNLPGTGESGKIYIVQDTNLTYRWSGTAYVEISNSLALGETSSTAYPGDKGKATTDIVNSLSDTLVNDVLVSQSNQDSVSLTVKSITKNSTNKSNKLLLTDGEPVLLTDGSPILLAENDGLYSQADDKTITINQASAFAAGVMSSSDKTKLDGMPDLVVTGGSLRHNSDSVSLNLIQQNLKNPDDAGSFLLKFNSVTDSTAGIILPSDKSKIDKIITNGDGTKYLADNGQYKTVQGGSADIEAIKKYVDDSVTSARSIGYMMQLTEIDASGLDENTWYPVTIAAGERENIRVEVLVALDSGTKPSWSTHDRGFSTRKIWEFAPSVWGVNRDSNITIYLSDFVHADIDPVRGLGNLSQFAVCYVFVRGGGKYHFYASHNAYVTLRTDTYKPSGGTQSVSPTTETPAEIVADIVKKKYVDNIGYGKVIDVADGSLLTINKNIWDTEAYDHVVKIFGSTDVIKNMIIDICNNHTKYYIHSYSNYRNCIELSSVYAYYTDEEIYEIEFNISYYTSHQGPVSKRIAISLNLFDDDKSDDRLFIEDILVSDNLQRVVKRTKSEYDNTGTKNEYTMYAITDA